MQLINISIAAVTALGIISFVNCVRAGPIEGTPLTQTKTSQNAINCSALYLIATASAPDNQNRQNAFMKLQDLFDQVYSAHKEHETKVVTTSGDNSRAKSESAEKIGLAYDKNRKIIYDLETNCRQWITKLSQHIAAKLNDNSNRAERMEAFLSIPPYKDEASKNATSDDTKRLVDKSISEWTATGRKTPYKELNRILGR